MGLRSENFAVEPVKVNGNHARLSGTHQEAGGPSIANEEDLRSTKKGDREEAPGEGAERYVVMVSPLFFRSPLH